jgi:hypothetical protein
MWSIGPQFAKIVPMNRRVLISLLCLSLAGLAPAPLAACAMLMAPESNCAPAAPRMSQTAEHCGHAVASPEINAQSLRSRPSKLPCCEWSASPAADATSGSAKFSLSAATLAIANGPQVITGLLLAQGSAPDETAPMVLPPDRQSLLSVFLI